MSTSLEGFLDGITDGLFKGKLEYVKSEQGIYNLKVETWKKKKKRSIIDIWYQERDQSEICLARLPNIL